MTCGGAGGFSRRGAAYRRLLAPLSMGLWAQKMPARLIFVRTTRCGLAGFARYGGDGYERASKEIL